MPKKTPKYKAKPVFWDSRQRIVVSPETASIIRKHDKSKDYDHIWRFDSTHEFKVYLELVRICGKEKVVRQHPLCIIPRSYCYPSGKTWRVDFAIVNHLAIGGYSHYIEAKGAFLPEFTAVLSSLEQNDRTAFDRVHIVFTDKIPSTNRVLNALKKGWESSRLITLKQLEESTRLL